ncbi:NBR1-Ig-like domain-containing protein [Nonomuraea longicatena]|uniref:Nbr1 FW domain-containing protein n=1 Tax=Nonomuraea longicatena TaxID=83682 RepID=A0ABP4AFD7_9ACTN
MDDNRARVAAIEDFAATLRKLRDEAGNPSFREMSGRSKAISHTTLHEAAKGNRLPSWETTVEFLKACGADPAAYRERWENANQAVRSVDRLPGDAPPLARPRALTRLVVITALTVLAGAAVVVVVLANRGSSPDQNPSGGAAIAAPTPVVCPVRPTSPPSAPPLRKGDATEFVEDVTLTDCTHVGSGQTMTKVWRIKNAGTVPWEGYQLRRLDLPQHPDHCRTAVDVPIADTKPGDLVDIRTDVITPRKPGLCYVRFKMVDASGAVLFPGSRPINFQIIVNAW